MVAVPRPTHLRPTPLADLAALLGTPLDAPAEQIDVFGVTLMSSDVRPGDLFSALPGANTHGIRFAAAAVQAGAVAILTDPQGAAARAVPSGTPVLVVPDPRAVLGRVCAVVYGDPSRRLSVLGVTGTNGKTTTSYLLEAALGSAGRMAGLIGTIETRMQTVGGPVAVPAHRTTPEAPDLQATLALMAEHGVEAVAMEVSSHALALDRVAGTAFEVAAFTNLSQDHLDFHGDLEAYFRAKALLFDGRAKHEVVMVDDSWGVRLVGPDTITVSPAGNTAAQWHSSGVTVAGSRTSFVALGPAGRSVPVTLSLPGGFNVANAMVALAILDCIGVDLELAATGLGTARVPGRMEVVDAGQPFTALVDYAHTPAAVSNLLAALRPQTAGAVILVLGCGGDRDTGKRSLMGEVAARGSDVLIITDDNPRSEDPAAIRASMRAGALGVGGAQRGEVIEVDGRADAIATAVDRARPGDSVVIAGKGHEQGQEIDGVVTPFDDRAVLLETLARHGWNGGTGS
ncbi:MAG: UDP-N-acetylmuramoyl-L-alanyl-D-glutamate--2,6-diaminopimelate ligase [Actinomycetota bacterium]|nr:UDP-N-acetylmuramoyl-L-alanyl-D-glutamate--2,6-diaminopimelate ligase [Actinomycetota bacterium]